MNRMVAIFTILFLVGGSRWLQGQLAISYDPSGNLANIASASAVAPSSYTSSEVLTLFVGDRLALSAVHSGTPPFTYQWRKDGSAISGATAESLFISAVLTSDAGTYSVVIANASGSVTNQIAIVRVLPTRHPLHAIAHNGTRYVSIGTGGLIAYSTDLNAWTVATSVTTNLLEGLTYGGGKFVAVGEKGTVVTSTDGISWTAQTSGNTNDLKSVAYGNSTYVAVGSKGTVITSSDGTTWTTRTFDNVDLRAVAFGNSKFVAVGTSGTIWVSTSNGVGWNDYTWPTGLALNAVIYANSKYVAAGENGLVLTSSDAVSWAQFSVPIEEDFHSLA